MGFFDKLLGVPFDTWILNPDDVSAAGDPRRPKVDFANIQQAMAAKAKNAEVNRKALRGRNPRGR
ncbi:MAG: hypothetical protein NVS3B29_07110 [Candidatus Saccharimonadales bacterium]